MIDYSHVRTMVDLDAIRSNYRLLKGMSDSELVAVVKCDAYGHGIVEVSRGLEQEGVRTFAAGTVSEAAKLVDAGIGERHVALLGALEPEDYDLCARKGIIPFVTDTEQLKKLEAAALDAGTDVSVCIKFNTGMGRLGFAPEEAGRVAEFLGTLRSVNPVMASSHLAVADEPGQESHVEMQAEGFRHAVETLRAAGFPVRAGIANTAGLMGHEFLHWEFQRPGIALYGSNPFHGTAREELGKGLRPAMSVTAPVLQVHSLKAGQGISYGLTYVADTDKTVAVVCAGYSDNYSRGLSNKGQMNLGGVRVPILGRVCMQMTCVDITAALEQGVSVQPGTRVHLLGGPGEGYISPEELASWWGTITYEVFCLLGMNKRSYV